MGQNRSKIYGMKKRISLDFVPTYFRVKVRFSK
jgi:hypothetical protein